MKQTKSQKMQRLLQISATAPRINLPGLGSHFSPEEMPELEPTPMGRHRLLQAFRGKYGASFRNKRGVSKILKEFDEQTTFIRDALRAGGV
jgi:hypothetical protein